MRTYIKLQYILFPRYLLCYVTSLISFSHLTLDGTSVIDIVVTGRYLVALVVESDDLLLRKKYL